MSDFWVNIPGMRNASTEIAEVAKYLEPLIAEISGAMNEVESCLSGECVKGIEEQLKQYSEELMDVKKAIESLASALVDISDIYESTEREVTFSANDSRAIEEKHVFKEETSEATSAVFYGAPSAKKETEVIYYNEKPTVNHDKIVMLSRKWNIDIGDSYWSTFDFIHWKTFGGDEYLYQEKLGFINRYREVIKDAAEVFEIPVELLAGVAFNEYGGDPTFVDDIAYFSREFDRLGPDWLDEFAMTDSPELTSFGNISIQVRRVAQMYGYDDRNLTYDQSQEIIKDIKDPIKNIYLSAAHLRDLKEIDYTGVQTNKLTKKMIKNIAIRYQRGPDLSLGEIEKDTTHYGKDMYKHMKEIKEALGE